MPYQLSPGDKKALGDALTAYYDDAWTDGVRGLFDKMAQSNMGLVTGYLDQAKDTYASLRAKSKDKFGIAFKATLKQQVQVYTGNRNDMGSILVTIGEKALTTLAGHIPIPMLGAITSQAISMGADKARKELHVRSIGEADNKLTGGVGGSAPVKMFNNDADAADAVAKAMAQYKTITNYIQALPATISTFDDAVTFPSATFKVQAAASSLAVSINAVSWYLSAMQDRCDKIQTVISGYKVTVREKMPDAVDAVLQKAYADANQKGKTDVAQGKFVAVPSPTFQKPSQPGGATQLAAYVANAMAQGYYDAGNTGPSFGRPRSSGAPPVPPKPNFRPR